MRHTFAARALGTRLGTAREAAGLTQQYVAKHLGLKSHQAVLRMESGERDVSTLEITQLARLYYQPLSFFFRQDEHDLEISALLPQFEELSTEDREEITRMVGRFQELVFLTRSLGRAPLGLGALQFDLPTPVSRDQACEQGEMVARRVRETLGLCSGPIANLSQLVEELGIAIARVSLGGSAVSGVALVEPAIGGCIVVNRDDRPERQLFTIAHQLFHHLADHHAHRCEASHGKDDLMEVRAEHFASALLMPRDGLEHYRVDVVGIPWSELEPTHVARFQTHFLVSYRSMILRLRHLRLISDSHEGRLLHIAPHHIARLCVFDADQVVLTSHAFDQLLHTLAIEAFEHGKISRGRLASTLEMDDEELAALLQDLRIIGPSIPYRNGRNPLTVADTRDT